jgi:hypothetical protein
MQVSQHKNVVEKQLAASSLSRHDLGREDFGEKGMGMESQSAAILGQMKRLGRFCRTGLVKHSRWMKILSADSINYLQEVIRPGPYLPCRTHY